MYRTLIVDDEPLMRRYLDSTLSAINPNFCVTGIACDGLEAVDMLQRQEFDLVITDIKMPEMDGLKLAKYIFDSVQNAKVIIISGYNEFEYARLAIKYGVSDYLLKPLNDNGIAETLQKIKGELDIIKSKDFSILTASGLNQYTDRELKSALLTAIISENSTLVQHLYSIFQDRNITLPSPYSAVLLLSPDELHLLLDEKKVMDTSSYRLEFIQCCTSYCDLNHYVSARDDKGNIIILISATSEEEITLVINTIYLELCHSYWTNKKIKINASYGCIVDDLMNLIQSYTTALDSQALVLKNVPSPISSKYYISQSKFINELKTICEALSSDFIANNTDKTLSDLYLYISLFEDEITIASILRYGSYLIRYLVQVCNIKTEYLLSGFQELTSNIDPEIRIGHFDKGRVHTIFFKVFRSLYQEDAFQIISDTVSIVDRAKEYICSHYHEQISLAMVADTLDVTPSYLSDLFHKSIGEPYTKFLTRIRMEQALLILRSNPNEKVYKVAEKTGFVSSKHFITVFKKFYGFTPRDYFNRS